MRQPCLRKDIELARQTFVHDSQVALVVKNHLLPQRTLVRSLKIPGEGNVNPLQYSCLVNPMDRGPWWVSYSSILA